MFLSFTLRSAPANPVHKNVPNCGSGEQYENYHRTNYQLIDHLHQGRFFS